MFGKRRKSGGREEFAEDQYDDYPGDYDAEYTGYGHAGYDDEPITDENPIVDPITDENPIVDPITDENPIVPAEYAVAGYHHQPDYYDEPDYDESELDDPDYDTAESDMPKSGPYDYSEVAELLENMADQRLDLGSVILPVPPGGQLQVEMTPDGTPQAVHLATEHGRLTVAAYAAPKSAGQWRSVAADLAESLRKDGARVAVETGPWGRELLAITEGADLRFIGVDGPRWMVRLVAAGPQGAADEGGPLVRAARAILSETVIRRGDDPMPVREPLAVVLPPELAEQLAAAHQAQVEAQQQALAAQQAVAQAGPQPVIPPSMPNEPRRGADGSAMQQLGLN
ncbi:DUF3710 domain-containing protein [Nocardia sp. CA-107356]|uniref:DUF3710 domain-containing protein n=1 Tax=Nocardia sp. CA-107356 TaxID=3239972 RepID=UPI003D8F7D06